MGERLNTFFIDMTEEKGNQFRLNGEPIDITNMQSIDIHIEKGCITIRTVELRNLSLGG